LVKKAPIRFWRAENQAIRTVSGIIDKNQKFCKREFFFLKPFRLKKLPENRLTAERL